MKKVFTFAMVIMLCAVVAFAAMACDKDSSASAKYTVYAPDGAPALAIAKMMMDGAAIGDRGGDYTIISANNVAASMTNGDADFIIAPTNAGILQSVNTGDYYMLGVTSWGNLYIVTTDTSLLSLQESSSAADFLRQFDGKSIASIGNNQVPDKSLKALLTIAEGTATVEDGTNAENIQANMVAGKVQIALLGEPAVTGTGVFLKKNGVNNYKILGAIADLWRELKGLDYPQAGVFVKKTVPASDVEAFVTALKASIAYFNESAAHAEELGNYMESREDSALKGAIVKQCYLRTAQNYRAANEVKAEIVALMSVLVPSIQASGYEGVFYPAE